MLPRQMFSGTVFISAEQPGDSQCDANKYKREKNKSPWQGFLSCRFTRIGGRTSQITSLQAGRTALWPLLTRKASGTTFPATTTCPTSARKEQVNKKCPQWGILFVVANMFILSKCPSKAQKPVEHLRRLRTWISFWEQCHVFCLLHHCSDRSWCFPELWLAFTHACKLSWTSITLKSSHPDTFSPSGLTTDTRLPSRGQTHLSSLSRSNISLLFSSPPSGPRWAVLILHVCCHPLQCCAEPHQQLRMPAWLAEGGRITTSTPWSATSAPKASSSATSLPSVAGPMVAGRDPGSSVQSVSEGLKLGILWTKSLLICYWMCFWSPPITPVQTPSPQSAPWAPRPPETQRWTQGQRRRTELLLNQIILFHICKA